MMRRIIAMAKKETLHIVRDWRTMLVSFAIPLIMLLLFGYAVTLDINQIPTVVCDQDHSPASRDLISKIVSSDYFRKVFVADYPDEIKQFLDSGKAKVGLYIPSGYEVNLLKNRTGNVQVLIDGSESNTGSIAVGYLQTIFTRETFKSIQKNMERRGVQGISKAGLVEPVVRVWYNPQLRSANNIIPGLVAVIMMIMTALLSSLTVVREREHGTMEQLLATPARPSEILIGKLIPYFVIGMVDCLMIVILGSLVFNVPMAGSFILLILLSCAFAFCGLGIGLRISTTATSQLFAMQLAVLTSMLPSFLLSGFMFAIHNMPNFIRPVTYLVPASYFIEILRGIFLKDMGITELYKPAGFLLIFGALMLISSAMGFKRRLDG